MTYLAGKIVLDVRAGAPNNGRGIDNMTPVKQLKVGRDTYPYVSAQAFRRWVRDSVPASEARSRVVRSGSGTTQHSHTEGRPDRYFDDDLFGYMVAAKGAGTFQRDTVFATGTLLAIAARRPERDFGTMSRGLEAGENPVVYEHQLYSAELAADILIDLPRIGTFEMSGSGVKTALTAEAVTEACAAGADDFSFRGTTTIRLPIVERRRRAALLLRTLTAVRGGAKRAQHYGDRNPTLMLLAPVKGGVNPFTRIFAVHGGHVVFDADVVREELFAWQDELDGTVYLGWAPGFLGDQREKACVELADEIAEGRLVVGHPRRLFRQLADQIEAGDYDVWFNDPAT